MRNKANLIIGLGGIGSEIAASVRQNIFDNAPYINDRTEIVSIDFYSAEVDNQYSNIDKLVISENVHGFVEQIARSGGLDWLDARSFLKKLPPSALNLQSGSGNIRSIARLALLQHLVDGKRSEIYQFLESKIYSLAQNNNDGFTISIISSIFGSTGSAWFFDIAYLVKTILQKNQISNSKINAILLLPNFRVMNDSQNQTFFARTYSVIRELERFVSVTEKQPFNLEYEALFSNRSFLSGKIDRKILDDVYLFDYNLLEADDPEYIKHAISDFLLIDIDAGQELMNQEPESFSKLPNEIASSESNLYFKSINIYSLIFSRHLLRKHIKLRIIEEILLLTKKHPPDEKSFPNFLFDFRNFEYMNIENDRIGISKFFNQLFDLILSIRGGTGRRRINEMWDDLGKFLFAIPFSESRYSVDRDVRQGAIPFIEDDLFDELSLSRKNDFNIIDSVAERKFSMLKSVLGKGGELDYFMDIQNNLFIESYQVFLNQYVNNNIFDKNGTSSLHTLIDYQKFLIQGLDRILQVVDSMDKDLLTNIESLGAERAKLKKELDRYLGSIFNIFGINPKLDSYKRLASQEFELRKNRQISERLQTMIVIIRSAIENQLEILLNLENYLVGRKRGSLLFQVKQEVQNSYQKLGENNSRVRKELLTEEIIHDSYARMEFSLDDILQGIKIDFSPEAIIVNLTIFELDESLELNINDERPEYIVAKLDEFLDLYLRNNQEDFPFYDKVPEAINLDSESITLVDLIRTNQGIGNNVWAFANDNFPGLNRLFRIINESNYNLRSHIKIDNNNMFSLLSERNIFSKENMFGYLDFRAEYISRLNDDYFLSNHIFSSESIGNKFERENQFEDYLISPQILPFLQNYERLLLFFQSLALGFITKSKNGYGEIWYQLKLPSESRVIYLTSVQVQKDQFDFISEALNTFVSLGRDARLNRTGFRIDYSLISQEIVNVQRDSPQEIFRYIYSELHHGIVFELSQYTNLDYERKKLYRDLIVIVEKIYSEWRNLLVKISKIERQKITEIDDFYVAGPPLRPGSGNLFVGRGSTFSNIENLWRNPLQPTPIVLFGQRRMGKTSILYHLADRLGETIEFVIVDLQGLMARIKNEEEFWTALSRELIRQLRDNTQFEFGSLDISNLKSSLNFDVLLDQIELDLPEGQRLALVFDEFEKLEERIDKGIISKNIIEYLRSLMQHRKNFLILLSGHHTLQDRMRDYWAPIMGTARNIKVSYLDIEEAEVLIKNPWPDFQLFYENEAIEKIYNATGGQPLLIQLACSRIIEYVNDRLEKNGGEQYPTINLDDVNIVIDQLVNGNEMFDSANYLDAVWGWLSEDEKRALTYLAGLVQKQNKIWINQDSINLKKISLDEIQSLIDRDILEAKGAKYKFKIELLKLWISKEKL